MTDGRVTIYLPDGLRQDAEAGRHNFIGRVAAVLDGAGLSIRHAPEEQAAGADPDEYALVHMIAPPHGRALVMRRVYHYPFWAIERSDRRWDWHVARATFDPAAVPRAEADRFRMFWRDRLFPGADPARDGHIYMPLQGRLTNHRSFQTCSPIDMIRTVLDNTDRKVIAALHPRETYGAVERAALDRLAAHPQLEITTGEMERWLPGCDMVVTENSGAGFNGFLLDKPCVLFARIDFHHIAANVADHGAAAALALADGPRPDFAGFVHWFWQRMSINAGRAEAADAIRAALRRGDWPV
jgi:hypothetical protein